MQWQLAEGSGFLVPERFKKRGEGKPSPDGDVNNHQPPDPSPGGLHGG